MQIRGCRLEFMEEARVSLVQADLILVAQALTEAMNGKPVSEPTTTPYGCSVKYP